MDTLKIILATICLIYLAANLLGVFREAWSYDSHPIIELGHYENTKGEWVYKIDHLTPREPYAKAQASRKMAPRGEVAEEGEGVL